MTNRRVAYILPAGDPASLIPPDVLTDDVTVDVVGNESFLVPTSPAEFLVTEVGVTEAALRASKLGYDGVLLTTPDYGLAAVRSALSVPVVGCAQASMLTAASLADRFSIVTIWPKSSGFVNRAVIERNGLQDRCVSVRHVSAEEEMATLGEDDNFYTRTLERREDMIGRICDEIEAAAREDGAQAVVLGCNCMTGAAPILAERSSIPVVDPTRTGYAWLKMMLALGLNQSTEQRGRMSSDRSELFASMASAAAQTLAARGDGAECEVCVLGDPESCKTESEPADRTVVTPSLAH